MSSERPVIFSIRPHAAGGAGQQSCQVACPVADHRQAFLGQCGEHQLAHLAVRQNLTGRRVDNFRIEMILPDMQPIFGLNTFVGDAGAQDFRQAIYIHRMHIEGSLDFLSHRVGPGLRPEYSRGQ